MTEEQAVTLTLPADHFHLYRAQTADDFACCFCKERIKNGDIYFVVIHSPRRRTHWPCMVRCVQGVVEKRDARGVSEDL